MNTEVFRMPCFSIDVPWLVAVNNLGHAYFIRSSSKFKNNPRQPVYSSTDCINDLFPLLYN